LKEVTQKKSDPRTQEEWLIYRKSVRFVMAKLHKELDDLHAINKYLQEQLQKAKQ
jgi:hypothetical protein